MNPRIAIPMPHSADREYAERAMPQYEEAVRAAGGEPVRIPLDSNGAEVNQRIESCEGVLLPGSKADVNPGKYRASPHEKTEAADEKRDRVDELLLREADRTRKPVLGICYGLQILNVHRKGTLLQHIESKINHAAGRKVSIAHEVEIDSGSRLADILKSADGNRKSGRGFRIPVNSSHHQSAEAIGEGLRAVARCPEDQIVEALEGTAPDHFVLAVQWHPERSCAEDTYSPAIFRAFVEAAARKARE